MNKAQLTNIEAILFDCDGVLLDSVRVKEREFRSLIEEKLPALVDPAMEYFWANGGTSRLEKFRWIWSNLAHAPLTESQIQELGKDFAERVFRGVVECPMIPGAKDFLEKFYPDLPAFVISGTPDPELKRVLEARQISHYFRGIFGSPRNKTQIGTEIIREHGFNRSRVFFIGDATTDRDAAEQLGVRFVGLEGPHLTPYLRSGEATIRDLTELEAVLRQQADQGG